MKTYNIAKTILSKCKIYYDNALISEASIIKKYISFLGSTVQKDDRSVSFALHTGSVCFDIVSVVVVALYCLSNNLVTNYDILSSLNINDMVMYKSQRYHWKGISIDDGEKYCILGQDGKGRNGKKRLYVKYEKNKHLVKPYFGDSELTDGRGIRKNKFNREDFISNVFDVPISEVPSIISVSMVIVANRYQFSEMLNHIKIEYGNKKKINILDIVPAAYYTSGGEEYQLGKNPTKVESVLKVTSNVSAARDLILSKQGNRVIGLIINLQNSLIENGSEISDLLDRRTLKISHISMPMNTDSGEHIIKFYENSPIFACTKEYLTSIKLEDLSISNKLVIDLNQQIDHIIYRNVLPIMIEDGLDWKEYKKIKEDLYLIKQSDWANELKNNFIISAHALLNLLVTAVFTMSDLEEAITNNKINALVTSPKLRISTLSEISKFSGTVEDKCTYVIDELEKKYTLLLKNAPKLQFIQEFLVRHPEEKIAIVVPKAYYIDIFNLLGVQGANNRYVKYMTANQFDDSCIYDEILVVGNIYGKRFDPLQCLSSKNISVLLYECERKFFDYRIHKKNIIEKNLNIKIGAVNAVNMSDSSDCPENSFEKQDIDITTMQVFTKLDHFIEGMSDFNIQKFVDSISVPSDNTPVSEVNFIGLFSNGEQIFFSKYYKAVVFSQGENKVSETSVERLNVGDMLLFARRDDYTRNVVDYIYDQLHKSGRLNNIVIKATEKARYWKESLRGYKEEGKYSYKDIEKQLKSYGSNLKEMAIRQWLMEDSHIVGPRNEKTMEYIAMLTKDKYLLQDPQAYFKACQIVRHQRKEILKLIGNAIVDKLYGNMPPKGSILEVIYENVDNLSKILELDKIYTLEEAVNIPISLINRPVAEMEVLI